MPCMVDPTMQRAFNKDCSVLLLPHKFDPIMRDPYTSYIQRYSLPYIVVVLGDKIARYVHLLNNTSLLRKRQHVRIIRMVKKGGMYASSE